MTAEQVLEMIRTILQPTVLLTVVGSVISLLTSYVPGFREWYAALPDVNKKLGQGLMVTIVTAGVGIVSFTGVLAVVPADLSGALILVFAWYSALNANQTTYKLSPQRVNVLAIKDRMEEKRLAKSLR